jgi:hypothetical protein
MTPKPIRYEITTTLYKGQEIPILVVKNVKGEDACDDKCRLCGLKVRGKHAFILNQANIGPRYDDDAVFLPAGDEWWDNYDMTAGAVAVGAECRKQLPPNFYRPKF